MYLTIYMLVLVRSSSGPIFATCVLHLTLYYAAVGSGVVCLTQPCIMYTGCTGSGGTRSHYVLYCCKRSAWTIWKRQQHAFIYFIYYPCKFFVEERRRVCVSRREHLSTTTAMFRVRYAAPSNTPRYGVLREVFVCTVCVCSECTFTLEHRCCANVYRQTMLLNDTCALI